MSKYDPNKHHRRSIRLKKYDYTKAGCYFLTLCVENKLSLFGKIKNGIMHLNPSGKIVQSEWEKTPQIRPNTSLGAYIVMPNHFHAILHIDYQLEGLKNEIGKFKSPSHTVGAIVRGFKGATTKKIKALIRAYDTDSGSSKGELPYASTGLDLNKSIWQRDYWDHIIRNHQAYNNITQYIINNPQKWQDDKLNGGKGNKVL